MDLLERNRALRRLRVGHEAALLGMCATIGQERAKKYCAKKYLARRCQFAILPMRGGAVW